MNDKQKETADTLQLCYDYCCVDEENALVPQQTVLDAIFLLRKQELPPVKPEKLEERTKKWLDEMTAKERLEEIAAILDDWDGYRTAKGLAELINEVWAYALYHVKEESKNPQAKQVTNIHSTIDGILEGRCPCCGSIVATGDNHITKFCKYCGQEVKWK